MAGNKGGNGGNGGKGCGGFRGKKGGGGGCGQVAGQKKQPEGARKFLSQDVIVGVLSEWKGMFGWITPQQQIAHDFAKRNKGRVYVAKKDFKSAAPPAIGTQLEFKVYIDNMGLGAHAICECPGGVPDTTDGTGYDPTLEFDNRPDSDEEEENTGKSGAKSSGKGSAKGSGKAGQSLAGRGPVGIIPEQTEPEPAEEETVDVQVAAEEAADDGSAPLLAGWERVWSEEHNAYYYWQATTQEASWTWPEEAPSAAAAAEEEVEEEEGEEEGPPPAGWEKVLDASQQAYYYWNKRTNESAWTRPEPELEASSAAKVRITGQIATWSSFFGWITPLEDVGDELRPHLANNQDQIYVNWHDVSGIETMVVGMVVEFTVVLDENGLSAMDVSLAAKNAAAATDELNAEPTTAEDSPLPEGWEKHWSEENSAEYYWHAESSTAAWARPTAEDTPQVETISASEGEDEKQVATTATGRMPTSLGSKAGKGHVKGGKATVGKAGTGARPASSRPTSQPPAKQLRRN